MNSTKELIAKAMSTRSLIRPGPMEKTAPPMRQLAAKVTPESAPPFQPVAGPAAMGSMPPMPMRQSAYSELMKKHDRLNPRHS